ncbi:YrhK family protein [Gracilibacillus caseinilyticus]|uniref:YrhK family protein n=1 Tax=Gracilibacillus caseinilyticus TaxID=2932256 RepID=A0ABY4EWI3_9BACI|nr:YrhK family protein [Gracilibacillus caseinilyticus]UOQ48391.1 YrhK family protein [Gracilibacillus caseinilyticus]
MEERSRHYQHDSSRKNYVDQRMKQHKRFYKNIYDILYTINDFTIAVWFLIGSIFFYFESLKTWGVTLFVIASVQFLIKPSIRLVHEFSARKHYGKEYDRTQL